MKYVAKVDADNYLFSLSKEEVLILMFGDERPEYNEDIKKDVREFVNLLETGKIGEITFKDKFNRIIAMYHAAKSFDGWNGFISRMDEIKKLFEPVQEYMVKFKDVK